MRLPISFNVELQRVPAHSTSNKKPGKTHLVLQGYSLHDIAQGSTGSGRWPWKHPVERVTDEEWRESPCLICKAALNGHALPGYV